MKLADFEMMETVSPKGVQVVLQFGDKYDLSIVQNEMSYGNKQGLYEIAVIDKTSCEQVNLPGITEEGDTVKGFLTESDVNVIIKKMHLATGAEPTQIC